MAPKNKTTGTKRTRGSTSGTIERSIPVPRIFDRNRYSSGKHLMRYNELNKGTWHEKTFNINPTGNYAHILNMITSRKWDKLLTPETQINPDIVREFYANALPNCEKTEMDARFTYTSFVRGTNVRFDRDTINTYLGNPLELDPPEDPTIPTLCAYGEMERDKDYSFRQIARDILLPGKTYNKGKKSQEYTTANFRDMKLEAGIIFQFLVHNVVPRSHVTTTPMAALPLLWHILQGGQVDVARIISDQMKHVALCGFIGKITKLSFPGLLMGLLKDQGVIIPEPRTEKLKGVVDDRYIFIHSQRLAGVIPHEPEPEHDQEDTQQQEDVHQEDTQQQDIPHPPTSFEFSSFQAYMMQYEQRQEQRDHFIMDQNAALYRSHRGIYQSLYEARMDPAYQMLSPETYMEACRWPGDRPIFPGGGSGAAFGGPQGDDHDMDDDDAAN